LAPARFEARGYVEDDGGPVKRRRKLNVGDAGISHCRVDLRKIQGIRARAGGEEGKRWIPGDRIGKLRRQADPVVELRLRRVARVHGAGARRGPFTRLSEKR